MIEKYLKNNNLIIVPNTLRKKVVREINSLDKLVSYKVIDLKEFLNNYFFSYDKKTIYYLSCKEKLSIENSIELLDNLYYIEDKEYNSKKLNDLVEIKKDLINHNLLCFNTNYKYYLEHTNIIVYGYDLDPFFLKILPKPIKNTFERVKNDVLEFNTIDDEVSYVCSSIIDKINSGIDINNIKIIATSEYELILKRIFNWFNIPINMKNNISLYDISIGKEIVSLLELNDFNKIIDTISSKIDEETLNKIINIFNNYIDFETIPKDMIIYDLKNTFLNQNKLINAVDVINLLEIDSNNINYVLGFNKENYPIISKDDLFFSDLMKEELLLNTTNIVNELEREKVLDLVSQKNVYLSYKLKTSTDNYEPSILINELGLKTIKDKKASLDKSNMYNMIKLAKEYDKYNRFGILSEDLKLLKSNYKDINYGLYSNQYNKVNHIFNKLILSYSQLDEYSKCPFSYYLKRILKLNSIDDDFYINVGNIFHNVLCSYKDIDFDFDKCFDIEKNKYTFTKDKELILTKLKKELAFDLEIIKKQELYTNFNKHLFEREFSVSIKNNKGIETKFVGKIDKVLYEEHNNTINASVIDYKTGSDKVDLDNIIYGLSMQLPIYMYLLKKSNVFDRVNIAGFYLQHLLNRDEKNEIDKTTIIKKEDALKLDGYSIDDPELLSRFDKTINESSYIKGITLTKDGSITKRARTLSSLELDKVVDLIDNTIVNTTNSILECDFKINPKVIDKVDTCDNCIYKDICFKRDTDISKYPKTTLKEYLGGE